MVRGRGSKYDDIHMTPDVSYIRNVDVAHEESDVAVGPIAKFVGALFLFAVVICVSMLLLFNFFERRAKQSERRPSPLARRGAETLPPEPRLQLAPGWEADLGPDGRVDLSQAQPRTELRRPQAEMELVYKQWQQELTTYGWEDRAAGTVRIPVERAKQMYLERQRAKAQGQTPGQQQPGSEQPPGTREQIPSPSSSGRTTERRNQ